MPELPEVETVRRGIEKAMCGQMIKAVQINRYDLRVPVPYDFGQQVSARPLSALYRRGKYIILDIDAGAVPVILHLGMSGRVRIFAKAQEYESRPHDHLIFYMSGGGCFAFEDPRRFGMLYLADSPNWQAEKPFLSMGPEPLDAHWSGKDLLDAVKNKKAPMKSILLDQRVVAGLGNIYVCEALYRAGVHPQRLGKDLTRQEANRLVAHIKDVLEDALASGGSTLRDYQHTDGSLGYFQHLFDVYDRADKPCRNKGCGASIRRIVQSGRSTFYCPQCQK